MFGWLVLLAAVAGYAAERPNFGGEWKLNVEESDFGQRSAPSRSSLRVEHRDPALKITRTLTTESGESTAEAVYSTDGRETVNKLPNGPEMRNTAKWEGDALVVESRTRFNEKEMVVRSKWALAEGGQRLTLVRTLPGGDGSQTEVFDRK